MLGRSGRTCSPCAANRSLERAGEAAGDEVENWLARPLMVLITLVTATNVSSSTAIALSGAGDVVSARLQTCLQTCRPRNPL